jgi:hypothetical protein
LLPEQSATVCSTTFAVRPRKVSSHHFAVCSKLLTKGKSDFQESRPDGAAFSNGSSTSKVELAHL